MCFTPKTPKVEPMPPAPAPAPEAPKNPALNEAMTNATNADKAVAGMRRGRSSLRIDLGGTAGSGSGLNIPG